MRKQSKVLVVASGLILIIVIGVIGIPVLFTYFLNTASFPQALNLSVAYYDGEGTFEPIDYTLPNLVEWMGCEITPIRGSDIQAGDLSEFDVLIWPGGHYPAYWGEVGLSGKTKIQEFVANGGGYLGICAGAYYACDYIVWMDDPAYPPPDYKVEGDEENLDLFPGVAWGPIFELADRPDPGYAVTQIDIINHTHPITQSLPDTYQIMYAGGPYFQLYTNSEYTILGTYHQTNTPAIATCTYDTGRVFLTGPHPEVEEHSDRDGWQWGYGILPEPNDEDSEWPFLYEAMRWLGQLPPTTSHAIPTNHPIAHPITAIFTEEQTTQPHKI